MKIRHNDKKKVKEFYDFVSPFFQELWGDHLHHGYWVRGDESRPIAQAQLVEHLAKSAGILPGRQVLDIGCGIGGSSIHLCKKYQATTTGITISPVQVEMAKKAASARGVNANFLVMDAEAMQFDRQFDVIWSVESVSHYQDIPKFFDMAAKILRPNGKLALIDWFKKENLDHEQYRKYILPIEKGMLVELGTMQDYQRMMTTSGLQIMASEIMNEPCAKTWKVGADIVKSPALWKLAAKNGSMFLDFLRAFRAMNLGFSTGNFVYGMIVAQHAEP